MATTRLNLGPHWKRFIRMEIARGRYGSAGEVVVAAFRELEKMKQRTDALRAHLAKGAAEAERYVEQRLRLTGLHADIKKALRDGSLELGAATAFNLAAKADLLAIAQQLTGHEPPASLAAKKKPELVAHVAAILAKAKAEGFDDARINTAGNAWRPPNLR